MSRAAEPFRDFLVCNAIQTCFKPCAYIQLSTERKHTEHTILCWILMPEPQLNAQLIVWSWHRATTGQPASYLALAVWAETKLPAARGHPSVEPATE